MYDMYELRTPEEAYHSIILSSSFLLLLPFLAVIKKNDFTVLLPFPLQERQAARIDDAFTILLQN